MMGDQALYHDGWIASTKVIRPPWDRLGAGQPDPANAFTWELYDLTKDWTQSNDVATPIPQSSRRLQDLFWAEAEKYQVLPLDATVATRLVAPRPSITAGRTVFTYSGESPARRTAMRRVILDASYNIKAEVDIPEGGAEGMIENPGGRFGGYGFYLLKGKPVFL